MSAGFALDSEESTMCAHRLINPLKLPAKGGHFSVNQSAHLFFPVLWYVHCSAGEPRVSIPRQVMCAEFTYCEIYNLDPYLITPPIWRPRVMIPLQISPTRDDHLLLLMPPPLTLIISPFSVWRLLSVVSIYCCLFAVCFCFRIILLDLWAHRAAGFKLGTSRDVTIYK